MPLAMNALSPKVTGSLLFLSVAIFGRLRRRIWRAGCALRFVDNGLG